MKLYFAPLEGITTYTYRNIHAEMFGGCDAYFAPFIAPSADEKISKKGLKDILAENNAECVNLKAQVLTNNSQAFLNFAEKIKGVGYDEININLGCPSGTVVNKGRGSGFLRDTDSLDRFLDAVFTESDIKISVKTRTGFASGEEMDTLMQIYNKYPLELLTIHPRTRMDFYKGEPDNNVFAKAYAMSKNKVCYNGNIFSKEDYRRITERFSDMDSVMIGRGAIKNPAIFREIRGGEKLRKDELIEFSERLIENYYEVLQSELYTLYRMKEMWLYIMWDYPEEKKILKAIKKADKLSEFMSAVKRLPEKE